MRFLFALEAIRMLTGAFHIEGSQPRVINSLIATWGRTPFSAGKRFHKVVHEKLLISIFESLCAQSGSKDFWSYSDWALMLRAGAQNSVGPGLNRIIQKHRITGRAELMTAFHTLSICPIILYITHWAEELVSFRQRLGIGHILIS